MPQNHSLNIVFAGTPDFAARHLEALLQSPHNIVAAYTQPDRPKGRGKKLTASPVKDIALAAGVPVYQPLNFKNAEDREALAALKPDIMIVVAYGLLLPQEVLDTPTLGCINVHGSLLPRWRGAAPIQRAIEVGDTQTGITIMQMDAGLDTGDMLLKTLCDITPEDTASSLHDKLAEMGPPALLSTLHMIASDVAEPEKQDDNAATYAHKLLKPEATIDWSEPAEVIHRRVRAFNPFPICNSPLCQAEEEPVVVKIYQAELGQGKGQPGAILNTSKQGIEVACGEHSLIIKSLQIPGKKPMDAASFLNGFGHLVEQPCKFGAV